MLGRISFINKIVSKNLGLEENKVADVNSFLFQELEREMRECNHPFIYVRGLGTFTLKIRAIENALVRALRTYRNIRYREDKKFRGTWKDEAETKKETIFELFRIRRLLRTRLAENKKLKNAGKSVDDRKGQCLQATE